MARSTMCIFFSLPLPSPKFLTLAQAGNPALTGPPGVEPATLQIDAAHPGAHINPMFYGLMIEEINHGLDGGLYGELIQNRVFKDDPTTPVHWLLVQDGGGSGSIALDTTQPVSGTALTTSLRVIVNNGQRVGAANDGYFGIPVQPATTYNASFWAKAAPGFTGPVTLDIETSDGSKVYASATVSQITTDWAKYNVVLTTSSVAAAETTRFVVSAGSPGTAPAHAGLALRADLSWHSERESNGSDEEDGRAATRLPAHARRQLSGG